MTARGSLALVGVLAMLLAGCAEDPPDGFEGLPSPSPSPAASASAEAVPSPTETVAAEVDPTVVPPVEEMTTEYVEAVVNTIEEKSGELFARVLAEPVNPIGAVPDGTIEGLEALYAGDSLQLNIEEAEALAQSEEARELALPATQYTGLRYEVLQVSYAEPECVVAVAHLNRDGTSQDGGDDPAATVLSLVRAPESVEGNPTPWLIAKSLPNVGSDGSINSDQFALDATLQDLEGVLPNDCTGGEESRVS